MGSPRHPWRRLIAVALLVALLTGAGAFAVAHVLLPGSSPPPRAYWGARIAGATYGYGDPPWDMRSVDAFEQHSGKSISILHWGQPWYLGSEWPHGFYPFVPRLMDAVRARGAIPMIDWNSWDYSVTPQYDQPRFSLHAIIGGQYDAYIRAWAGAAKAWAHPFFLRFDHEMNGTWYPWSEKRNSNAAGDYVKAWRHVHDIFTKEGATNVTWVWCVNVEFGGSIPLAELYPGDAYTDWIAMDGYNVGASSGTGNAWTDFTGVFGGTYRTLLNLAPHKPVMIAETSSTELGGSKATWITDALTRDIPKRFPNIRALVWFNDERDGHNWTIESSASSTSAFAAAIGNSYYAAGNYGNLSTSSSISPP